MPDHGFATTVDICLGATTRRTMLGIPTGLCLGMWGAVGLLVWVLGGWWLALPAFVAHLFFRWKTRQDPCWLGAMLNNLRYQEEYR